MSVNDGISQLNFIRLYNTKKRKEDTAMTDYEIEKTLHDTLLKIKPPRFLKGFYQLKYTLLMIMENDYAIDHLYKEIFPVVADKFKCSTDTIERNIRTFIKHLDRQKFEELVGCPVSERITVKHFIYILLDYLQSELYFNKTE